jgi:hypothetical protein
MAGDDEADRFLRLRGVRGEVTKVVGFAGPGAGLRLVTSGNGGPLSVWDPVGGEPTAALDGPEWEPNDIVVCRRRDDSPVVAISTDLGVEWYDTVTGQRCFGRTSADTIWGLAAGRFKGTTVWSVS